MADLKNITILDNGNLTLPLESLSAQLGSVGEIRVNTSTNQIEYLSDAGWTNLSGDIDATSTGSAWVTTVVENNIPYEVHTFYGSGTFTPSRAGVAEYLVIAGGGGGGGIISGGGGAGGVRKGTAVFSDQNYTITVGSGGIGGRGWDNFPQFGTVGTNSSIVGPDVSIVATGGGGGGGHRTQSGENEDGGSGGGGSQDADFGIGIDGQGNNGGPGDGNTGGGGGGYAEAGAAGPPGTSNLNGRGGNGLISTITGHPAHYAGGGGQGVRAGSGRVQGYGGLGGGGQGTVNSDKAFNGANYTGGGGGGGGYNTPDTAINGGFGGNGIVVIRYRTNSKIVQQGLPHSRDLILDYDFSQPRSYNYGTNPFTVYDLSQTGNDSSLTSITSDFMFTGDGGGALNFDGVNDFFNLSTPIVRSQGVNFFTLSVWIKPLSTQRGRFITPNTNGIDNFVQYSSNNVALVYCQSADTNGRAISAPSNSTPVGVWSHVAATINVTRADFYVNGQLVGYRVESFNIGSWQGTWRIGQRGNSTNWYRGLIANLRIWNTPLAESAILAEYNYYKGRFGR